jgi:hypothetical protein
VTLLWAGCGRADNGQVSVGVPKRTTLAQVVATAAAATSAVETGTFKWVTAEHDANRDEGVGAGTGTATGSFDRPRQLSDLVIASSPDSTDGDGSDGSELGPSEIVVDGTTEYMKMDGSGSGDLVPGGAKKWVSLTIPASMATMTVGGIGFLDAGRGPFGDGPNPLSELELLTGGVTDLGSATVDGTSTSHYAVTLTAAEAARTYQQTLSTLPADFRAQEPTATQLAQLSPAHIEVWIDSSGIIRRFTLSATGVIGFGGEQDSSSSDGDDSTDTSPAMFNQLERGSESMTYDLLTANQPVQIEIPPADQVFNESSCIGTEPTSSSTTLDPTAMAKCISGLEGQTPSSIITALEPTDSTPATPPPTR